MKKLLSLILVLFLAAGALIPGAAEETGSKELRILATSDLHGKFMPWDYALNEASLFGSMTQLATAVAEYRTDHTLLVDAGDLVQDNAAEIFLGRDEVHPMVLALNALKYDIFVTGNHEYNYGMDAVRRTIADLDAKTLTGNVADENGDALADGYAILDMDGIRVAVIGMVTPLIQRWDAVNTKGCTVTDPLEETRKIIDAIQGQYDVLVGVFHMSIENEYGVKHTGVRDILKGCPEFDVMVASHGHTLIPSMDIGSTLVVENKNMAQTMAVIDLTLEKDGDGWKVAEKKAESVSVGDYEPDPALTELLAPYDAYARADAETVIGRLEGGPLAPENETRNVPEAVIRDTALVDLINTVLLHYSGADVAAMALFTAKSNMQPGPIRKCDISLIYKYTNTLYKLHMTGAQLKKYMEWCAAYYKTWQPGDQAISFRQDIAMYNYDMFEGVNYEINIANEPGNRIQNLTWPDGRPVEDGDEFDIAVNNYRANTHLLAPGVIYQDGDLPTLEEAEMRSDIGGIRELIRDYIVNVKNGVITPECNDNWKIVK